MNELTIESVPSGAEVQIDGEVIGSTPLTLPMAISLEEFRVECLYSWRVSCDWNKLKSRLEDHTVSRLWWDFTPNERRSIAEVSIKNTLYYPILEKRKGKADCAGGTEEWGNAACVPNSIIRYLTFGDQSKYRGYTMSTCYYKDKYGDEICYTPEYCYKLPCFMLSCRGVGHTFGHSLIAIQVRQSADSLDDWIVFQYGDFDIKPGNHQMPYDSVVYILNTTNFTPCGGLGYNGNITTFEI